MLFSKKRQFFLSFSSVTVLMLSIHRVRGFPIVGIPFFLYMLYNPVLNLISQSPFSLAGLKTVLGILLLIMLNIMKSHSQYFRKSVCFSPVKYIWDKVTFIGLYPSSSVYNILSWRSFVISIRSLAPISSLCFHVLAHLCGNQESYNIVIGKQTS